MNDETPGFAGLPRERLKGLEPSTFCMASRRSSQLSYSRALARQYSQGSVEDLVEREAVAEGVVEVAEGDAAAEFVARADARARVAQDRDRRVEVLDAEAQRLALVGG